MTIFGQKSHIHKTRFIWWTLPWNEFRQKYMVCIHYMVKYIDSTYDIVRIICPICISFNGKPIIKLNPFLLYCQLLDLASFPEQYFQNRSDEPNSHCDLFRSVLISLKQSFTFWILAKIETWTISGMTYTLKLFGYMHNYSQ